MRKIYSLTALLLILTSCVDDIYPGHSGPEKMLGMDADLFTTDTLHKVMLYYSGYDSIEYAGDLTVSIYVNGDLRDETSECRPYYDKPSDYLNYPALYDLRATFSPGDKVRIVARNDEFRAEAEVEVPEGPSYGKTGYSAGTKVDPVTSAESRFLEYRVEVQDSGEGTDYYTVEVFNKKVCIQDDNGEVVENVLDRLELDVSREPLLSASFPSSFDFMSSSSGNSFDHYKYWAFTDNSFTGDSYTLSLRNYDVWSILPRHSMTSTGHYDENGNYVQTSVEYTMRLSAVVRLSRVSRAVYSRYMAKSFDNSALSTLVLFDSTHEYPSNVKGGIGMVNVFSSEIREIEIGTFHYDMWNFHQIEDIFGD
ncbi:MAG: DUF4249 family protein [Candidatus Cryptobacteroides sp.]